MEKKIKIILIILVFLTSCKTTKQVEKLNASIVEKVQTEQKTESKATETEKLQSKTDEKVIETDSTVIEETELHFSAPDSTGKQHVETAITRKTTSGKKREGNKNTETDQSKGKTNNQVDTKSKNKQSDSNLESELKTTKKSIPIWPFVTAGVIAVAVFLFWRFGGFGWLKVVIGRLFGHRSI